MSDYVYAVQQRDTQSNPTSGFEGRMYTYLTSTFVGSRGYFLRASAQKICLQSRIQEKYDHKITRYKTNEATNIEE